MSPFPRYLVGLVADEAPAQSLIASFPRLWEDAPARSRGRLSPSDGSRGEGAEGQVTDPGGNCIVLTDHRYYTPLDGKCTVLY